MFIIAAAVSGWDNQDPGQPPMASIPIRPEAEEDGTEINPDEGLGKERGSAPSRGSDVTEVAARVGTGPIASHPDPSDRRESEDPCPSGSPVR
jgi:hypothetical protein